MNFQDNKEIFLRVLHLLEELGAESPRVVLHRKGGTYQKKLRELRDQLDGQRFVVGVVGAFNSGKSTLLNAMLHRNLLSTHILPETAALTTLSFQEEEQATVHFWSEEEWHSIREQARQMEAREKGSERVEAIKAAEQHPNFEQLILRVPHKESVPVTGLRQYTSANDASALSQLVREVDLGVNLDFCKDNIDIVDTPGLNDPVEMRENITKRYFLPRCDAMVFVVPAMMAFTMHDRRFLQEQLRENRLHRLFVVVNKIDQLNHSSELPQILDWVRSQLGAALKEGAKDMQQRGFHVEHVDEMIQNVELFPVAAYQACLLRTGQEERATFNAEDAGVGTFEERLKSYLFEGERAQEFSISFQSKLRTLVTGQLELLTEEVATLGHTLEQLQQQIREQKRESMLIEEQLQRLQDATERAIRHFESRYQDTTRFLVLSLRSEVPRRVEQKAFRWMDEYLDHAGLGDLLMELQGWMREQFEPALKKLIQLEVEDVIRKAMSELEISVKEVAEDVTTAYMQMGDSLAFDLPDQAADYTELILELLKGAAMGLALREALIGLAGLLGGVAIAGVLSGPVGWAIMAATALVTVLQGGERLKKKLRSELRTRLPKELEDGLSQIASQTELLMQQQKPQLVRELRQYAEAPAQEIRARLQDKQQSLEELLQEKKSKEFDRQQREAQLANEQRLFKQALSLLESYQ